jgi:DNA gyrase/topoisomerase IV subunit A
MDANLERNQVNIEDEMRRSYLDYAMSVWEINGVVFKE